MTETIVVGLDGAHWELLDPWIEAGDLPALKRLRDGGVAGDLRSCLPPVTCPNWKCSTTGKNPGKLGAFWWERVDVDRHEIGTIDGNAFSSPETWDYFNACGFSTAVINVPTTYPPRPIDGCLVAGGPDAERDGYTHPDSLQSRLETEYGYQLRPTDVGLLPDQKERIAGEVCDLIDTRFDVALDMSEDHEFVQLTVFYINVLQHFFWRDPVVKRAWQRIDDNLARLLDRDANIVVYSDHGSTAIDRVFNINAWLRREGYLVLDRGASDVLSSLGITTENAKRLLSRLGPGWYSRFKNLVPDELVQRVPTDAGSVKRDGKAALIDWEASTAVAGGQGPIYLLSDDPAARERLANDIETLSDPLTGRMPVREVHPAEAVYHGERTDDAPDIVLDQSPGWHIAGAVGADEVFRSPERWAAENKRTGLFVTNGPAFASQGGPDVLSILDIAPTLLHLYGLPVPDSLDGTVAREVFATDTEPKRTEPAITGEYGRGNDIDRTVSADGRDRLRDLGYL